MLKSLFKKIKSEKQESNNHHKQSDHHDHDHIALNNSVGTYQFQSLTQENVVKCSVSTIRYRVQPNAPNVYNQILACPISVFNVLPYAKRKVKQIDLRKNPCPFYIDHLKNILKDELPTFNHLLVNVYPPGIGIMPHFDGPMYRPKVVVLSLGGPAIINFKDSYGSEDQVASVLLEDQSVHIFEGDAYEKYLHGIKDYFLDSIFLKIGKSSENEAFQIQRSSIKNLKQTKLYEILLLNLNILQAKESKIQNFPLGQFYGVNCNQEYNFKLEIQRKERISITIREKYEEK